jgi:hypothetical protein
MLQAGRDPCETKIWKSNEFILGNYLIKPQLSTGSKPAPRTIFLNENLVSPNHDTAPTQISLQEGEPDMRHACQRCRSPKKENPARLLDDLDIFTSSGPAHRTGRIICIPPEN